jgi:1-phosphofructokinase
MCQALVGYLVWHGKTDPRRRHRSGNLLIDMIVTLTMNPCVDLNLEVEAFEFGTPLRAVAERKRAGGKGVNVSQALAVLGVQSVAVVPLGGPGGDEFAQLAEAQFAGGPTRLVAAPVAGNTRTNIVTQETRTGRQLKVNQQGPLLTEADAAQAIAALDEYVGYGDVVALCGSLPRGVESGFYAELVRRYRARGAFVALDGDGEALRLAAEQKPHAVKPNREELSRWAGEDLDDPSAFHLAAGRIARAVAGLCLATSGASEALLAGPDFLMRLQPPEVSGSAVGAGDAALAGLLAGITRAGDPARAVSDPTIRQTAFRLAVACGAAAASTPDTEMFTAAQLAAVQAALGEPEPVGA